MTPAKTPEEAQKRIAEWSASKSGHGQSVHEYLGWTREQYLVYETTRKFPDLDLMEMNEHG
jgi:hypothetical protein